ncbi:MULTISPECIES: hypothetical protein [Pyrobaculum]|uniref:PaREP6 domain containing protein / PaREP6 domain containing protein n=2 Tax=Pyrobaculum arsenaticum TaxID=121277 RepID=A4WJF5_PYRAR|nr:hypothetical protein [Pyrobaculum arsenaticum]ABP50522.1 PaREP6 domain containing protein / PaREP6 domain containing protein [Pyrobaculum arsenaticum DSM 13514]MCY0890508.1 hypothetical protein [Pyrobaculum arsenaticum]NYR14549.1 hypothetical protein [Pyrobaculum arsenaticum]
MQDSEVLEWEEEARRIRRERADWQFISSLPPRLRAAVKLFIETGDIRLAQSISGLDYDDFRELLRKARVPVVL